MAGAASRTRIAPLVRWTVNVVLLVVTLGSAAYVVPSLLGYESYVITGGSMSGTFEKGALAFGEPVPVAEVAVGDVITYLPPREAHVGNLVTHRVVRRGVAADGEPVLRTQGDANADADPWRFTLEQPTVPVVRFTVPVVGHVLIALADRETRMVVVGVPAGLIALASLAELVNALRRPRRETPRLPALAAAG